MKNPDELVIELCDALALKYEAQDWGIVNADATRVEEFVRYYETTRLEETQAYEVFELILASLNAALDEDLEIDRSAWIFVEKLGRVFPAQIDYWSSLSESEFPIGKHLREIFPEGVNRTADE